MITPSANRHYMWVGRRRVDDAEVNVWDDGPGRRYIAQTTVMTGRLLENQGGAAPFVIGALVLGALAWWFLSAKEAKAATAPAQTCPITDAMLVSYVKTKPTTYTLYIPPDKTQPVASWPPPKANYSTKTDVHAFSPTDCGFYKWDGTKWVSDDAENTGFAKYIGASIVKGPPMLGHPAELFLF